MSLIEVVPHKIRSRGIRFMAAAAALYFALRLAGFHKLFADDAEGIAALLTIIGTLYSVVYAFATYVIWGQFAAVENEILQESGALKDLILFSKGLKETLRDPIVRSVRAYARAVGESEWGMLSRGEGTEKTDKMFSAIITSVIEAKPDDISERTTHEHLLQIANQASSHRDERLALSAPIVFLLLFFPFHNIVLGVLSMAVTTTLLFFAHFVLTDLDNPFEGTWNVGSQPFEDLASKYR
jgi:hypothetical protein